MLGNGVFREDFQNYNSSTTKLRVQLFIGGHVIINLDVINYKLQFNSFCEGGGGIFEQNSNLNSG